MQILIATFRFVLYFFSIIYIYYLSKKWNGKKIVFSRGSISVYSGGNSIPLFIIIIDSITIGIYSVLSGVLREGTDRWNYTDNYINKRWYKVGRDSLGLELLERILNRISSNPYFLVFSVAFLSTLISLVALNLYKADKKVVVLIGCSQYFTYSFYLFKQSIAIALSSIAIYYFFRRKWGVVGLLILIATMFHVSALIIIPAIIVIYMYKYKLFRIAIWTIIIFTIIGYQIVVQKGISFIQTNFSFLSNQIEVYLNEEGSFDIVINCVTALKGMPVYLISIYGLLNKKRLFGKINHYNEYLWVSFFASVFTMFSAVFYWAYRFGAYFYLPSFVFATKLYTQPNNKYAFLYRLSLYGFLFFTGRYLILKYFIDGGF